MGKLSEALSDNTLIQIDLTDLDEKLEERTKKQIEWFEKDAFRQARGKLKDVVKAEKNKFLRKDRNKPFEK